MVKKQQASNKHLPCALAEAHNCVTMYFPAHQQVKMTLNIQDANNKNKV